MLRDYNDQKNYNIELRAIILTQSLEIEADLSEWLSVLFRIKREDTKTLGNRGSAMSFKAKCDLLSDLDRIEPRLYKDLIHFMEFRNQLIHNLNVGTLSEALSSTNEKNRLKSFAQQYTLDHSTPNEEYFITVEELFYFHIRREIVKGITKTLKEIQAQEMREFREKVATELIDLYDEAIDEFAFEFKKLWTDNGETESEIDRIIMSGIRKKIKASIEKKYNIKIV